MSYSEKGGSWQITMTTLIFRFTRVEKLLRIMMPVIVSHWGRNSFYLSIVLFTTQRPQHCPKFLVFTTLTYIFGRMDACLPSLEVPYWCRFYTYWCWLFFRKSFYFTCLLVSKYSLSEFVLDLTDWAKILNTNLELVFSYEILYMCSILIDKHDFLKIYLHIYVYILIITISIRLCENFTGLSHT